MPPLENQQLEANVGYDVLVVGGGIQGCGIAQAAAAAGYRVLLIERNDWGSGTSSRSSKLIHGGLRYLESGQFSLIRKALKERQLLLEIAPDLVKAVPFLLPVYRSGPLQNHRGDVALYSGLQIYRWLGRELDHAAISCDFDRFDGDDPELSNLLGEGFERDELEAVYRYWDAQTDDRLLTRAVAYSARQLGADVSKGWELSHAQPCEYGWRVDLNHGIKRHRIEATAIVNACGPWVTQLHQRIFGAPEPLQSELVQGSHIVIEGSLGSAVYYLEATDQRGIFVMPWGQDTLVGTTEVAFKGDPALCQPSVEEVDYLRENVRRYFPDLQVQIKAKFAGLRVLPHGDGGVFHRARDTRLQNYWSEGRGLVSVYGGKLTTYRITAQRVIEELQPYLGLRQPLADTATLKLVPH
ncbi:MAG: FAD-dependent oxidoreductase [Motiliproteus sp.]